MLTKAGKVLLKSIIYQAVQKTYNWDGALFTNKIDETIKYVNGEEKPVINIWRNMMFPSYELNLFNPQNGDGLYWSGIYFGSDGTPPSENDYKLTFINSTQMAITKVSNRVWDDGDKIYCECLYDYKNNSSNSVTIREFGLIGGYTTQKGTHLIYRDTLPEPVTVDPDETKRIKVTVDTDW